MFLIRRDLLLRKKPGHGRRHADDALPPSVPPTRRPLRRCRLGRRSTRLGKSHYFLLILLPVRASPNPRALRGLVFFAVPSSSIPGPSPLFLQQSLAAAPLLFISLLILIPPPLEESLLLELVSLLPLGYYNAPWNI